MFGLNACESSVRGILNFLAGKKMIAPRLRRAKVDVYFLPNSELRRLKKKYLKKDAKLVDVLSFPEKQDFPGPGNKKIFLGEILINKDIAGHFPVRARYLLLHGLLHLLGYDHVRKGDNIKMQKAERLILANMGWREE